MSLTYAEAFTRLVAPAYHVWGEELKKELAVVARGLGVSATLRAANAIQIAGACYNAWNGVEGDVGPVPYANARQVLRDSDLHPVIRHKIQGVAPQNFTATTVLPGVEPKKISMLALVNHIEGGAGAIGNRIFQRRGLVFVQIGIPDDRDRDERYLLDRLYSISQPLTELYQSVVETDGIWITDVISREQTVGGGTFHTVQARFLYDQTFDEPQITSLVELMEPAMAEMFTEEEIRNIARMVSEEELQAFRELLRAFAFKNGPDVADQDIADTIARDSELAPVKAIAEAALPKSGGTMTGALVLSGAPTADTQAATKKYVDDNAGTSSATDQTARDAAAAAKAAADSKTTPAQVDSKIKTAVDALDIPEQRVLVDQIIGVVDKFDFVEHKPYTTRNRVVHEATPRAASWAVYSSANYLGVIQSGEPTNAGDRVIGNWFFHGRLHIPIRFEERTIDGTARQDWFDTSIEQVIPNNFYLGDFPNDARATEHATGNNDIYYDYLTRTLKQSSNFRNGTGQLVAPTRHRLLDTEDIDHTLATKSEIPEVPDIAPYSHVQIIPIGIAGSDIDAKVSFVLGDKQTDRTLSSVSMTIQGQATTGTITPSPGGGDLLEFTIGDSALTGINNNIGSADKNVAVVLTLTFSDGSEYVHSSTILLNNPAFANEGVDQTARDVAAAAKTVADAALPKSGGTMTGKIVLDGAPTSDLHAATKKYVDDNAGVTSATDQTARDAAAAAQTTADAATTVAEATTIANARARARFTDTEKTKLAGIGQLFRPRGAFKANTAYAINDVVLYNGHLYYVLTAVPSSNTAVPTDGTTWALLTADSVPTATTTRQGTVELATQTEMGAGTANRVPDAAKVKTYVDARASQQDTAIAAIRQLPAFPSTGSRDNKVPKFDGNDLKWEEDATGDGDTLTGTSDTDIGGAFDVPAASSFGAYPITEDIERDRYYKFFFRVAADNRYMVSSSFKGSDFLDLDVTSSTSFSQGSSANLLAVTCPRPNVDGVRTFFLARPSNARQILVRVNDDYNIVRLTKLGGIKGEKGDKGDPGSGSTDTTARAAAAAAQTIANAALARSGGTMTGKIILDGPPTADLHAATKKYVDDNAGGTTDSTARTAAAAAQSTADGAVSVNTAQGTRLTAIEAKNATQDTAIAGKQDKVTVQALTDGVTIDFAVGSGKVGTVILGGSRTVRLTGGTDGDTALLRVTQDATGSRTLTLHSSIMRGGRDVPTLSTAASQTDLLLFHRIGTVWHFLGIVQNA